MPLHAWRAYALEDYRHWPKWENGEAALFFPHGSSSFPARYFNNAAATMRSVETFNGPPKDEIKAKNKLRAAARKRF